MKKNLGKLKLSRETLRTMTKDSMAQVAGEGRATENWSCINSCDPCLSMSYCVACIEP